MKISDLKQQLVMKKWTITPLFHPLVNRYNMVCPKGIAHVLTALDKLSP